MKLKIKNQIINKNDIENEFQKNGDENENNN